MFNCHYMLNMSLLVYSIATFRLPEIFKFYLKILLITHISSTEYCRVALLFPLYTLYLNVNTLLRYILSFDVYIY